MRFLILLVFFLLGDCIALENNTNIAFITICKSGTNLVQKCIFMLMESHYEEYAMNNNFLNIDYQENWQNNGYRNSYHYYFSHFGNYKALDEFIEKSPKMKFIFNIRDPRDVCLSSCFYIDKLPYDSLFLNTLQLDYPTWLTYNLEKKLSLVINSLNHNQQFSVLFALKNKYPNILLVNFENLVGKKGGGSDLLQKQELIKIAKYLGLDLSSTDLDRIANNLFGGTKTFYKGQIGEYKKAFKDYHYKEFFQVFEELIEPLSEYYDLAIPAFCHEGG